MLSPDKPEFEARRIHSHKEVAKYGIEPEWFRAIPHPNGRMSAALSVIAIAEAALLDSRPLLLLEDDISSWNPQTGVDAPDDADIVRIGISSGYHSLALTDAHNDQIIVHMKRQGISNSDLVRTRGMFCTHAIIFVSKRAKRALAEAGRQVLEGHDEAYDAHIALRSMIDLVTYSMKWPVFYQDWVHSRGTDFQTKVSIIGKLFYWGILPQDACIEASVRNVQGERKTIKMNVATWKTDELLCLGLPTDAYRAKCETIGPIDWVPFHATITVVWPYVGAKRDRLANCVESFRQCHPLHTIQVMDVSLLRDVETLTIETIRVRLFAKALVEGGIVVDGSIVCQYSLDLVLHTAHCWHKQLLVVEAAEDGEATEAAKDGEATEAAEDGKAKGCCYRALIAIKPSEATASILSSPPQTFNELVRLLQNRVPTIALPADVCAHAQGDESIESFLLIESTIE